MVTPMPKNKLDLQFPLYPVFILCLAFILLLLTLSPYIRTTHLAGPAATPTPAPQSLPSITATLPASSPTFSTYSDNKLKIQISYPDNWAVNASPPTDGIINFDAPDGSSLNINVTKTTYSQITDYLANTKTNRTVVSSESLESAGYQAVQRTEKNTSANLTTLVTYFLHQNRVYAIEIMPVMEVNQVSADQITLYNQILSSIKFL